MPKSVPSDADLQQFYSIGVGAAGAKWKKKIDATSGAMEAAKSDAAEASYAAGVSQAVASKLRQKGLAGVSDADWKAGVNAVGPSGYTVAATAKAGKFVKKARPYIELAISTTNALPPRTADAAANVAARVTPIAVALQNKKRAGG